MFPSLRHYSWTCIATGNRMNIKYHVVWQLFVKYVSPELLAQKLKTAKEQKYKQIEFYKQSYKMDEYKWFDYEE